MDKIPLNQSMVEAETSTKKGKSRRNRKKNKKKQSQQLASAKSRERSNTTEDEPTIPDMLADEELIIKINESYLEESKVPDRPETIIEEASVDNSTFKSKSEVGEKHEKVTKFISKVEDEEEHKMFKSKNKHDFDYISDKDSEMSFSVSLTSSINGRWRTASEREEEVKELYIDEPKWTKSSSWMKPMPHREYKIKAIWSNSSGFDTMVHRRYKHFVWLRNMLLKEYEHWAVPVLPEKSVFEKVFGHTSDFIKERMRKMKHFLTLIMSHRKLKQSEHFLSFLWENDKVFKITFKSDYDSESETVKQPKQGWLSLASSSLGKVFNKAKEWELEKIIPGVQQLLSIPDEEISGNDILVKQIEDKITILRASFIEFYKLVSNIFEWRSTEYSLEKKNELISNEFKIFVNEDTQNAITELGRSSKDRVKMLKDNMEDLKTLIYAVESHIVWIESIQDIISRKHEIGSKITDIKHKLNKHDLSYDNVETCQTLLDLTQRRENIIKGIMREMEKLKIGTKDFYSRYIRGEFIKLASEIYDE